MKVFIVGLIVIVVPLLFFWMRKQVIKPDNWAQATISEGTGAGAKVRRKVALKENRRRKVRKSIDVERLNIKNTGLDVG
jgi:hypothetical protein